MARLKNKDVHLRYLSVYDLLPQRFHCGEQLQEALNQRCLKTRRSQVIYNWKKCGLIRWTSSRGWYEKTVGQREPTKRPPMGRPA